MTERDSPTATEFERTENLWNNPTIPKSGWELTSVHELDAPTQLCTMCGSKWIKYVHTVDHPDGSTLEVGCVCAGNLTGDKEQARRAENRLRSRANLRSLFVKKPWKYSKKNRNTMWLKTGGFVFFVSHRPATGSFGFGVKEAKDDDAPVTWDARSFQSGDEAALAAFDTVWPRTLTA